MLAGATVNDDLNLRLQYLAGFGLNSMGAADIYKSLLTYRKFPEGLLTGKGEPMDKLRELLGRSTRVF